MQAHSPETAVYELPVGQRIAMCALGCLLLLIVAPLLLGVTYVLIMVMPTSLLAPADTMGQMLLGIVDVLTGIAIILALVGAVLALAGGIGALTRTGQVRLVISPDGIEFYPMAGRIVTSWSNVKRIGWLPYSRGSTEGLVLRETAFQGSRFWNRLSLLPSSDRFIPLSQFDPWWQEGPIGRDIQRYAPHLFR